MLLRLIRDERPQSAADLARLSKRAEPNLLHTLGKLEAFGLIEMQPRGRRRIPVSCVSKLSVEIDSSRRTRFEVV